MCAEKNEDLAKTRQYDYGKEGMTRLMVSRLSWVRSRLEVLNMFLILAGLGLSLYLLWMGLGVWEDIGYLLEYGQCGEVDAGLELEIISRED